MSFLLHCAPPVSKTSAFPWSRMQNCFLIYKQVALPQGRFTVVLISVRTEVLMWHQNTMISWVKSDSILWFKKKKSMEKSTKQFAGKKLNDICGWEENLEGSYLPKLGPGQGNEVNEPISIKNDPGIFMAQEHTAGMEPGLWLREPLWHKHRKRQHSR